MHHFLVYCQAPLLAHDLGECNNCVGSDLEKRKTNVIQLITMKPAFPPHETSCSTLIWRQCVEIMDVKKIGYAPSDFYLGSCRTECRSDRQRVRPKCGRFWRQPSQQFYAHTDSCLLRPPVCNSIHGCVYVDEAKITDWIHVK